MRMDMGADMRDPMAEIQGYTAVWMSHDYKIIVKAMAETRRYTAVWMSHDYKGHDRDTTLHRSVGGLQTTPTPLSISTQVSGHFFSLMANRRWPRGTHRFVFRRSWTTFFKNGEQGPQAGNEHSAFKA